MFTIPGNLDPNSTASVSLLGEGSSFATLRLRDFSADIIGLDDNMAENVKYNFASTLDEMYGKWYKVEMFVDAQADSYAVKINGRYISPRYSFFFPASSSTILGTASPVKIGRLRGIEFRQDWYSQNAGIWIDNIEIGSYDTQNGTVYVDSLRSISDKVICGTETGFIADIRKSGELEDVTAYIGLYKNKTMCGIRKVDNIQFENGVCEAEVYFDIPDTEGEYEIKAFLWNDSMKPLSEVYPAKIEAVRK